MPGIPPLGLFHLAILPRFSYITLQYHLHKTNGDEIMVEPFMDNLYYLPLNHLIVRIY